VFGLLGLAGWSWNEMLLKEGELEKAGKYAKELAKAERRQ